jgi:hypothetical protein
MTSKKRNINVFSLSFLDCICCGFGAIILLFVLSRFSEPNIIEQKSEDLRARSVQMEKELADLRGETAILNRELTQKREQLSDRTRKLARLQGDLTRIEGSFSGSSSGDDKAQEIIQNRLSRARQELTEEMKRLLKQRPPPTTTTVGGIPVDSEYIIFIIDTSGSMQRNAWPLVLKKIRETLDIYPKVRGIQVMNDMGTYMFSQYSGRWIPDTPGRRRAIISMLSTWRPFSNSSPVEGIDRAIRDFYASDKKISLYVFGDEFSGGAIQPVLDAVDRINRPTPSGQRRVRIHAVGFPVVMEKTGQLGNTGQRFATLMRMLCQQNGGTFVGLNSTRK